MNPPALRPSAFSPARRFTWLMSALIAVAAAYAGVALWIDAAAEREVMAHEVEEISRLAAERTDDYLRHWHAVFDALSDHECLQFRRPDRCARLLERLQRRFPDLVNFVATDHRGEVVATGAGGAPAQLGGQPYFRALIAGRARALLEPRQLPANGERTIGIAVARRDDGQRFAGVIGISTRLAALQSIWTARRPYPDVGLLVLNADQRILFAQHDLANVEGRHARELGLPAGAPEAARRVDFSLDGADYLAFRAPVGDGEWSLVAYRRVDSATADSPDGGRPGYKLVLPLALLAIAGGALALRGQRIQQRLAVSEDRLQQALARTELEVAQRTRALTENEARYRALFDRSPNGVVILDRDGRIVEFNRNAANQLGYPAEDFARLDFGALEAGDGDLPKRLRRLLAERGSDQYETRLRTRSGHLVDMLVGVRVIELASGAVILAVLTDLSPIQRIRELQRRLQSIVEASRDAIVLLDTDGRVLYANPGSELLFGRPAGELRGQPVPLQRNEETAPESGALAALLADLAPPRTAPFEIDALHRDGRRIPAELTLASWEEDGRRLYSGILRDMTERRQAQDRLQFTQKMEAVGILAGGIAHDFNNLLAIMLGHGQLICDRTPESDPVRSSAEKINKAVLKARALIKQLLDFSRASDEAPKVMSLADEIRDVEALIRSAVPRHVQLRIEASGSLGAVRAVPHQIQQVFINLINNACDAIGGVPGTVEVRLAEEDVGTPIDTPDGPVATGHYVVARVLDTGPGISEAIHDRIFLPFFTTKEVGRGTGLGLAVVRNIMRQSHGHIRVFNRLSGGACFELFFPLVDSVPAPEAAVAPEVAGRGECVIFVDDEPEVVEAYAEYLRRVGFATRVHGSAANALDDLERNPAEVRVVVSDLAMPGMDGLELAHAIHRRFPALPVLLLTGRGERVTHDQMRTCGIAGLIAKPAEPRLIAAELRRTLDREARRG